MARSLFRPAVVAVLAALLVGIPGPHSIAGGEYPPGLPPCPAPEADPVAPGPAAPGGVADPAVPSGVPADPAAPGGLAAVAPPRVPSAGDPLACRARPTRVEPAGSGHLPVPRPGYHHLGATTADEWAGVVGRLQVRDTQVRSGSRDFVATRFLAKRGLGEGRVAWLEVGWAQTGWSGAGGPRIYTFDSAGMAWAFFDEYPLADGDLVWVYLHGDLVAGQVAWQAWLWWGGRWRLLAAPDLPLGEQAQLEQYVEVYLDRAGTVSVPPIEIDQVRVAARPGGRLVRWRADQVPTAAPHTSTDYCLAWRQEYDAWSAGDCPVTVQE